VENTCLHITARYKREMETKMNGSRLSVYNGPYTSKHTTKRKHRLEAIEIETER